MCHVANREWRPGMWRFVVWPPRLGTSWAMLMPWRLAFFVGASFDRVRFERLLDSCVSCDVRDDWIDRQLKTARPNRLLSDPGWGRDPHGFNVTGLLGATPRWRQCKTSGCPRPALSWQDPTGAFPSVWVKEGTSQSAIDVVYAALRLRNDDVRCGGGSSCST